jgi:hypothetical protein
LLIFVPQLKITAMTNSLVDALRTRDNQTENGMVTNSSTLNACVDLFFTIGAMRGQDKKRLVANFSKAFNENPLVALRTMFWARDVRGGAGERQIFKDLMVYLAENHVESLAKNLSYVAEYGRWDDLLVLFGTKLDTQAKNLIVNALNENNGLCAKWMPRKGKEAIALERYMKLTPKAYRKMLVEKTKVVEQLMCSNQWGIVTYEHVPSVAMARYGKAFGKHDATRFDAYKNGDTKVNASAVFPYDVLTTLKRGDQTMAVKQWDALPNYMEGSNERVLPVCDVSGSMSSPAGKNGNVTCMDVCISLGLYISERNEGKFKDAFVTFSETPKLQYLNGNLKDRYHQLQSADWGMSTNLEAVFTLVLNQATKFNLPESEMPTTLLIMSDMEFNQATRHRQSALDMIREKYETAGYTMPKLAFWNIQSRNAGNFPVQVSDNGTALVSGFSPAILKSLLTGEDMSPIGIMNKTVNSARYEPITA